MTTYTINVTPNSNTQELRSQLTQQGAREKDAAKILQNYEWKATKPLKSGKLSKLTLTDPHSVKTHFFNNKVFKNKNRSRGKALKTQLLGKVLDAKAQNDLFSPMNDTSNQKTDKENGVPETKNQLKSNRLQNFFQKINASKSIKNWFTHLQAKSNTSNNNQLLQPIADGTNVASNSSLTPQPHVDKKIEWRIIPDVSPVASVVDTVTKAPNSLSPLRRLKARNAAAVMDTLRSQRHLLDAKSEAARLVDGFESYLSTTGQEATEDDTAEFLKIAISHTGRYDQDALKYRCLDITKKNLIHEINKVYHGIDQNQKPDPAPESKKALSFWQALQKALKSALHFGQPLNNTQRLLTETGLLSLSEVLALKNLKDNEVYQGDGSDLFQQEQALKSQISGMKDELQEIEDKLSSRSKAIDTEIQEAEVLVKANQEKRQEYLNPDEKMLAQLKTLPNPLLVVSDVVSNLDDEVKIQQARIVQLEQEKGQLLAHEERKVAREQIKDFQCESNDLEQNIKQLQSKKSSYQSARAQMLDPENKAWDSLKSDVKVNPTAYVAKNYDDPIKQIDTEIKQLTKQKEGLQQAIQDRQQAVQQGTSTLQTRADSLHQTISELEERSEQLQAAVHETGKLLQAVEQPRLAKHLKTSLKLRANGKNQQQLTAAMQSIDQMDMAKLKHLSSISWHRVQRNNVVDEFQKQSVLYDVKQLLKDKTGVSELPPKLAKDMEKMSEEKLQAYKADPVRLDEYATAIKTYHKDFAEAHAV